MKTVIIVLVVGAVAYYLYMQGKGPAMSKELNAPNSLKPPPMLPPGAPTPTSHGAWRAPGATLPPLSIPGPMVETASGRGHF